MIDIEWDRIEYALTKEEKEALLKVSKKIGGLYHISVPKEHIKFHLGMYGGVTRILNISEIVELSKKE